MSSHPESNTPRWVAFVAAALALLFVALLAYKVFTTPQDDAHSGGEETHAEQTDHSEDEASHDDDALVGEGPLLDLELKDGTVKIQLRPDLAPKHVAQILTLVEDDFYDGIVFHRVIEGFMAQTGDPTGTGMGGSELPDIPAEFTSEASFERGAVGMARAADPNSANSQFFIMFDDAPHLDGQYTIVGYVVEGMEFVDMIRKGAPEANGTVNDPDTMISLSLAAE